MPASDTDLDADEIALGDALDGIDGMLLSELDGYLAGIYVCPDLIMPSEWLPPIWTNGTDDDGEAEGEAVPGPVFENLEDAQTLTALIMARYNRIGEELMAGDGYQPIFHVDERDGEVLWEFWIEGFSRAVALRIDAWAPLLEEDGEALDVFAALLTLGSIHDKDGDLSKEAIDTIVAAAPDLIPECVAALHAWRLARLSGASPRRPVWAGGKVGRNDPCPCGSGRKFKRCCGAN